MRFFIKVTLIVLFCFINIGFCEDQVKVVVIPLLSDEMCTGNASSDDVLSGKTFSNSNDKGITGTMPDEGSLIFTPGTANIPIDQGYYNGTGYVEGDPDLVSGNIKSGEHIFGVSGDSNVVNTSQGDAVPSDMLKDKNAYAGGNLVTGTVDAGANVTGTNGQLQVNIPSGLYSGSETATANDSNLIQEKIKDGVTIFGVEGTFPSDGTATIGGVKTGSTFYTTSGTKLTGSGTKTLSNANDTVAGGYYDATTLSAVDTDLTASNIKYGVTIFGVTGTNRSHKCGAYITPDVWKIFDCYNLAAIGQTTNDDPFTPSWRLIGGYWQWGRKGPDSGQWYTSNTVNFAHGPTGPDAEDANSGSISGWDTTHAAPDGSWSDTSKKANDPCPAGYRVPIDTQWTGVIANNTQSITGSWSNSATNYSSAQFFGNDLMLPAAGYRDPSSGSLSNRGYDGYYWSSSQDTSDDAWSLYFSSSHAGTYSLYRRYGFSVRCVAE